MGPIQGGSQIRHIFPPGGWQQGGLHLCVEAQAPPRSGSRGSCSATSSRSPSSSQASCGACSSSTCSTSSWTFCWSQPCSPRPAGSGGGPCGGPETPCNIARYYVMIVHCMISVLSLVYKIAYFGIHLTNTVSVFRLESSPVVTRFANL